MKVSEMVEWLKTQDQDATVLVVKHSSTGCGYYEQGGTATTEDFSGDLGYESPTMSYGDLWEFYQDSKGNKTLLLGVHNG